MKKVSIILLILAIVITGVTCGISNAEKKSTSPPDGPATNFRISAGYPEVTLVAYSNNVDDAEAYVEAKGYWLRIDGAWVFKDDTLHLPRFVWGKVEVERR